MNRNVLKIIICGFICIITKLLIISFGVYEINVIFCHISIKLYGIKVGKF